VASAEETGVDGPRFKAGYDDVPQFGGPSSVGAELREADAVTEPLLRLPALDRALKPWFDLKERFNRDYGVQFGVNYSALYQKVTESPGEDQAAGGIFELLGSWTLFGRGTGYRGSVTWKVENRHRLGTDVSPVALGFEAGSTLPTGSKFSDFGWGVTNLFWRQELDEGRFVLLAGRVDPTDYVDIYGLINPLTQFQNLAFLTDPTIAAPDQGLGVAGGGMATKHIYLTAGVSDANGSPTRAGFDTFFGDAEYFTYGEIGWVSSFERRYFDNIHVTAWHVDERQKAGRPDGWGLAFSATWFIHDQWMPFLRGGYSEGGAALLEGSVSTGIGYFVSDRRDLVALGVAWGRPSAGGLRDQYTAELFYRLQLAQNLAVTPSVQVVIDPALNPAEHVLALFGLRARVTF